MSINFDQDLVLVIGASGKTASAILPHLLPKWKRLRLVCATPASLDRLNKDYPNAEVVRVDLADRSDCRSLLREYLQETDLNWTIIQPSHMIDSMQRQILEASLSTEPEVSIVADFNAKTRFTNVFRRDLGEGVARIIEQREKHYFASYPFVSMKSPMSHEEMWEVVGKVLGKSVKVRQQSFDEALRFAKSIFAGHGETLHPQSRMVAVERTLLFYNRKGLIGNPGVLAMVLGRQPTTLEDWIKQIIEGKRQPSHTPSE